MTGSDDKPTGEDAIYAALFTIFLKRRSLAFDVAVCISIILMLNLVPEQVAQVIALTLVAYLVGPEIYAAIQRRRLGVFPSPGSRSAPPAVVGLRRLRRRRHRDPDLVGVLTLARGRGRPCR